MCIRIFLIYIILLFYYPLFAKENTHTNNVWSQKNFPPPMDIMKKKYRTAKKIWADFKKAKKAGTYTPILDYSYAGYNWGESLPPYFPPKAYTKKKGKHAENIVNGLKVFNVVNYGANPKDYKDDWEAVNRAAQALKKHGQGGVLFFPKGRYFLSSKIDKRTISLSGSNILVKGEGASKNPKKGTILIMTSRNLSKNQYRPYPLFDITGSSDNSRWGRKEIKGKLTRPIFRGTHKVFLSSTKEFKSEHNTITLVISFPARIGHKKFDYYMENLKPNLTNWRKSFGYTHTYNIIKVDKEKNIVYTKEALLEDYISPDTSIKIGKDKKDNNGIEDLYIECGWRGKFKHNPGNLVQDGWEPISMKGDHCWIRNVVVANPSSGFLIKGRHNTIYNCLITGNQGHLGMTVEEFSLILNVKNNANSWHGLNLDHPGTVVWKYKSYGKAGPDHHAKNGQSILFDSCILPSIDNHGGAKGQFPHHSRFLLFWNTTLVKKQSKKFWGGYFVVKPSFIGITDPRNSAIAKETLGYYIPRIRIKPQSLYEEQLKLRLKKKPVWLKKVLKDGKALFKKFGIYR